MMQLYLNALVSYNTSSLQIRFHEILELCARGGRPRRISPAASRMSASLRIWATPVLGLK